MVEDATYCISGVTIAKKEDFIPLQTADFLSNTCSTYDRVWFGYLMRGNNRYHAHLMRDNLIDTSNGIKAIISHHRNLRRKAKKKEQETNS